MLKKVLNLHEEAVNQRLRTICDENGASVYAKLRVADVLPIENSGISNEEYTYALKSHFDFVVVNSRQDPLFAVEFDGPSHDSLDQTARDTIKNRLAERFGLPLLRIRSAHLLRRYDGWDLLSWIVDIWFLNEETDRMYANGELPYDFDFDPAFIISSPNRKRRFPYWLGLDAQLKIRDLQKKGAVLDTVPSVYHGIDDSETHRALAFLRIDRQTGVLVTTAMRSQQMRLDLHEPLRGVLFNDLYYQLKAALADPSLRVSRAEIDRKVKTFAATYKMLSWGSSSPPEEGVKRDVE